MSGNAKLGVIEQVIQEFGSTQLELVSELGLTQLKSKDLPLNRTEINDLLEKAFEWQTRLDEATKI